VYANVVPTEIENGSYGTSMAQFGQKACSRKQEAVGELCLYSLMAEASEIGRIAGNAKSIGIRIVGNRRM
jgi:hypothetical protein